MANLLAARGRIFLKQFCCGQKHCGRAEATLQGIAFEKRRLQHCDFAAVGDTLDGLDLSAVDLDSEIAVTSGRSPATVIATEGEAFFRDLELTALEGALRRLGPQVIACGGGLVVQPGMLELLKTKGVVVCLHASIETILARTGRHGATRPLLDVEDPDARARALYAEREPVYRSAGTVILTDSRPLSEIAAHVIRVWRRESAEFVRRSAQSGA